MFKNVFGWFVFGLLVAGCNQATEQDLLDAEAQDLASAVQPLSAKPSTNYRWGTQTGSPGGRCTATSTAQVCAVPANKAVKYYIIKGNSAISDADKTAVRNAARQQFADFVLSSGMAGWTFDEVAEDSGIETMVIVATNTGICGTSTGTSNNTNDYGCILGATSALSEPAPVNGSFVRRIITTVHVEVGELHTRGASTAEDTRLIRALTRQGILKALGIGQLSSAPGRCSSQSITQQLAGDCGTHANEICVLASVSAANPTQYAVAGASCGD